MLHVETDQFKIYRTMEPGANGREVMWVKDVLDANQNGRAEKNEPVIMVNDYVQDGAVVRGSDKIEIHVRTGAVDEKVYSLKDYMKAARGYDILEYDTTMKMPVTGGDPGLLEVLYPSKEQHPFYE